MSKEREQPSRVPASWDILIEHATNNIDPAVSDTAQYRAVDTVWQTTREFDNEEFEANRFFGLELAAHALINGIKKKGEESFLDSTAESLQRAHYKRCKALGLSTGRGLYVEDLDLTSKVDGEVGADEFAALSLAQRIVANTLQASVPSNTVNHIEEVPRHTQEHALTQNPALAAVAKSSLSAASSALQLVVKKIHVANQTEKGPEAADLLVADAITIEELRELNLVKMAVVLARLRRDEIREADNYIMLDEAKKCPYVDRTMIPSEPKPVDPRYKEHPFFPLYHEARLGCPARHVPYAITQTAEWMPEIAIRGQILTH